MKEILWSSLVNRKSRDIIGASNRVKFLIITMGCVLQSFAYSESFYYQGEVVRSSTAVEKIECGQYEIRVKHESFSFKYENKIPDKYAIKGFYGPATTISKQAVIYPAEIVIPNANDVVELKDSYLQNRTYLVSSAICKSNLILVSYWSGGNCSKCETFVSYEFYGDMLQNPKKLTYGEFKNLLQQ